MLPRRGRVVGTAAVGAVGVAQMFRTPIEQAIGVIFVCAALVWLWSAWNGSPYSAGIGAGVVSVAFASRAGAVLGDAAANWSGAIIIAVTWGSLSALFGWSAWRTLNGLHAP